MLSLRAALEKLKQEIDSKRQKDILAACQSALDSLPPDSSSTEEAPTSPTDELVYWSPFKLCCNPVLPTKLRETTLDILQKLLANSSLRGGQIIDFVPGEPTTKPPQPQDPKGKAPATPAPADSDKPQTASYPALLIDDIIHSVIMATPLASFNDGSPNSAESNVHLQIIKVLLTSATSPTIEVHESSLLKAIQACINIWLYSKNLVNQTTAKASLTQMIHFVFAKMEKAFEDNTRLQASSSSDNLAHPPSSPTSISIPEPLPQNNPYNTDKTFYDNLLVRDAYFVLRLLCRFAMKTDKLPSNASSKDSDDLSANMMRTRAVSLEMILMILNNAGPVVQYNESFIAIIRSNVTAAISKNGLLTQPQLFELALSIFLILLKSYKSPLKSEIEVLFNEIYLYILDNPNSTYKQKAMVLNGLLKICNNPQMIVDIYLNYDCDLNGVSIYERIISCLAKIAQGSGVKVPLPGNRSVGVFGVPETMSADTNTTQERKLRSKAVRCLTAIVVSLSDWMREAPGANGVSLVVAAQEMGIRHLDEVEKRLGAETKPSPTNSSNSSDELKELEKDKRITSPTSPPPPTIITNKNPLHVVSMSDSFRNKSVVSMTESLESPSSHTSGDNPEEFERVKTKKSLLKQGIAKFNEKPGKGIEFLKEVGFLIDDESIVKFLRSTPELNKTAIGDFIGEGKEANIVLMHKFIDSFDFHDVDFVVALRKFLQTFRLPGEAQKIDRIMEKFAARYCENNQKIFAKADTAYTLAFSIMMLNTDLHSSKIKNKMTKQDFLRNNRGINDNGDLPEEFLSSIYDNISQNEIVMEEERTVKELEKMLLVGVSVSGRELDLQRREIFKKETKSVEKKSLNLMKKGKDKSLSPFRSATHIDHARPMFEVLWPPLMASISTVFEECTADDYPIDQDLPVLAGGELVSGDTNNDIITLCLLSFSSSVKISCLFQMDTERDAFISSLGKLSALQDITLMKSKNVAAARMLISTATKLGNYLDSSWKFILKCISDMDKWQIISEGSVIDEPEQPGTPDPKSAQNKTFLLEHSGDPSPTTTAEIRAIHLRRPSLAKLTAQFQTQQTIITIDKIFANSVSLDGSSILHFYESLCEISLEEIESSRIYSLQKVVEISYYNMNRIRLEWTQIWKVLTSFFNTVGCHKNLRVANYAVDSLRQLGMKFLVRDELAHFSTNNEFMKPFEHIVRHTKFNELKELIIQSLNQMVSARAKNIKSGWRSIFLVLSRMAIDQPSVHLIQHAFGMLGELLPKYWELMNEFLVDYANSLVDFALIDEKNAVPENGGEIIIDASIRMLSEAADKMASCLNEEEKLIDDDFYLKWFPVISGLSRIQRDSPSASFRARSLDACFEILTKHGIHFSFASKHWKTVIKSVVMPLFEDLKLPAYRTDSDSEESALRNQIRIQLESGQSAIWIQAIRRMIELYGTYYSVPKGADQNECFRSHLDLVKELLELILLLVKRNSQNLAHTGVIYLGEFIKANADVFDSQSWETILTAIEDSFTATIPTELLRFPTTAVTKQAKPMTDIAADNEATLIASIDVPHAILKCATHLLVLEFVRDLALEKLDEASSIIKTGAVFSGEGDSSHLYIMPYPTEIFSSLRQEFQQRILSCLHASFIFAHAFNENNELRLALLKAGAVPQMPYLIKQETQAIATYLTLLFHCYRFTGDLPSEQHVSTKSAHLLQPSTLSYREYHAVLPNIVTETTAILTDYLGYMSDANKHSREMNSWSVVVCLIWKEIVAIPWGKTQSGKEYSQFKKQIPHYFRIAIKMMSTERADVRISIQQFMQRVADVIEKEDFLKLL